MTKRSLLRRFTHCLPYAGAIVLGAAAVRADAPGPNAPPIQVIAIRSDDAEDQADALTAALRNRVRALRGFSLGEGDYALEVLTLGLKCGEVPDEACQIRIGNHIHADRYVWGHVKRSKTPKQVTADLHLWTRGRPSGRTEVTFSDGLTAPGDEALRRLVDDALATLLERPKTPPAASAAPVAAARPAPPSAPARPASPPSAAPAPPVTPAASAPPADVAPAEKPAEEAADVSSQTSSDFRGTAGWVGLGLGAALVGAGIYSVVRAGEIESDDKVDRYRQGFRPEIDSCEQAKAGVSSKVQGAATPTEMQDFCSSAGTFQTLEFVFFGLGAVSAGLGVYLLATDTSTSASAAKPRFAVRPSFGRSGGRVQIGFTF